jgi:hypothetical protein
MITYKKQFNFGDDTKMNLVDINISENDITENTYYVIVYTFDKMPSFISENDKNKPIFKNDMTEKLIKYLLMDFDKLKKKIGNFDPVKYKIFIIKTLFTLGK